MRPAIRFKAIEREHLRNRQHSDAMEPSPLTLLCAPAGYGKTVAMLTWFEGSGVPDDNLKWIQVRADWEHPRDMFWRCVLETVTGMDHHAASHLPVSIIREELERFLRGLESTIILVIDNFETLTAPDFDLEVAALADTPSLREAAEALYISPNTLKTHLRHIYRKLRVANRDEAVQRGRQTGLIT